MPQTSRLLVLGMGNSLASDDAVGLIVAQRLRQTIADPRVDVKTTECGGLAVLDLMQGYDAALVIDAIKTGRYPAGALVEFRPEDFECSRRSAAVHDVGFFTALELGRTLGVPVPQRIAILAIEIVENSLVAERLTPAVAAALEPALARARELLAELLPAEPSLVAPGDLACS